jgi:hypothetical protein
LERKSRLLNIFPISAIFVILLHNFGVSELFRRSTVGADHQPVSGHRK